MSDEVTKLTARVTHAQASMFKSLGADLAEASRRLEVSGSPRIDEDTAIYNEVISQIVRLYVGEFNNIIDSPAVQDAVNNISKSAAKLKREAKRVGHIAENISAWQSRIDTSSGVVGRILDLA